MTRALAMEYGPSRHPLQCRRPGRGAHRDVARELALDGVESTVLGTIPTRRLTEADEVANVVMFLASDASSAITGETLSADGGIHATVNLYPTV